MTRCHIIPPYMLEALLADADPDVADRARTSLRVDAQVRAARAVQPLSATLKPLRTAGAVAPSPHRVISDARHTQTTPGTRVRGEGDPPTDDKATDEAYDGLGDTWTFYESAYGRDSIDGRGMTLLGTVHYGRAYDNAFWDGTQMIFGDGDGTIFNRFTIAKDVIGHELTHGVTAATANLTYSDQPGALNESISDVFGSCVKQMALGQTAAEADWLIGEGLLAVGIRGRALRDMLHPGTAYDDPRLGTDPQPADMSGYVTTGDDNGGVHTNSGIPNRAFALAATSLGGHSWEVAGAVWYAVLTGPDITPDCDFATFARLTGAEAAARHGVDAATAVATAWERVGVTSRAETPSRSVPAATPADTRLLLRRTGGFAGLSAERQLRLADLPADDRRAWQRLLVAPTLAEAVDRPGTPDGYSYTVVCQSLGLEVSVAESHLPPHVQSLLERTLLG